MSTKKPDYTKGITDSLKEGAIITAVTIGEVMILKYLFKMSSQECLSSDRIL